LPAPNQARQAAVIEGTFDSLVDVIACHASPDYQRQRQNQAKHLEQAGGDERVVDYLANPPTVEQMVFKAVLWWHEHNAELISQPQRQESFIDSFQMFLEETDYTLEPELDRVKQTFLRRDIVTKEEYQRLEAHLRSNRQVSGELGRAILRRATS